MKRLMSVLLIAILLLSGCQNEDNQSSNPQSYYGGNKRYPVVYYLHGQAESSFIQWKL